MKRTDLHKNAGLKINNELRRAGTPDRFGSASSTLSRKEQRKLDQEKGLVPFAVKLDAELVKRIQDLAQASQADLNETVAALLTKGLAG